MGCGKPGFLCVRCGNRLKLNLITTVYETEDSQVHRLPVRLTEIVDDGLQWTLIPVWFLWVFWTVNGGAKFFIIDVDVVGFGRPDVRVAHQPL